MTPPRVILALLCGASRVNVVAPEIPRRGHEQQRNVWLERRGVRHWRVGSRDQRCRQRAGGSGSWRLGDRGNNRPSHQVRQGGGHRRARPLSDPRASSGDSFQAWARRTQAGQAMTNMATGLGYMGVEGALKRFADWTDRIAGGELPFEKPRRPQGIERNVVITMWDWSTNKAYLHDAIS